MPRPKKTLPTKDLFLAAKLLGMAMQINTDVLDRCVTEADDSYQHELQLCNDFAKAIQNRITERSTNANQP